jgi:hypothetical protein
MIAVVVPFASTGGSSRRGTVAVDISPAIGSLLYTAAVA